MRGTLVFISIGRAMGAVILPGSRRVDGTTATSLLAAVLALDLTSGFRALLRRRTQDSIHPPDIATFVAVASVAPR